MWRGKGKKDREKEGIKKNVTVGRGEMKDRNRGREVERKEFVGDVFLTLMLRYREKKTQLWRCVEASCACQEALKLVNWLQSSFLF